MTQSFIWKYPTRLSGFVWSWMHYIQMNRGSNNVIIPSNNAKLEQFTSTTLLCCNNDDVNKVLEKTRRTTSSTRLPQRTMCVLIKELSLGCFLSFSTTTDNFRPLITTPYQLRPCPITIFYKFPLVTISDHFWTFPTTLDHYRPIPTISDHS